MVVLYKQDGEIVYGIKEYLLDSSADITELPTNIRSGSTAIVIPTGVKYVLNGSKKWVLMGGQNSSGGGNGNFNQYDQNSNGVIDQAEVSASIALHSF